jgi:hypothetical protein
MKAKRIFAILLVVTFLMSAFPMVAMATTAPTFVSAQVNGQTLTITFGTCPLKVETILPAGFTIGVTSPVELDPVAVSTAVVTNATTVTLGLDKVIPGDAVITVSYTGSDLMCADDVAVGTLTNRPVTVNTPIKHEGDAAIVVPTITYDQIRQVVLPTSAAEFTFILDPQGLVGLTNAEIAELAVEPGGTRLGEMKETVITECDEDDCEVHKPCTVSAGDCDVHDPCTEDDCEECEKGGENAPCNAGTTPCNAGTEDCTEVKEEKWSLLDTAGQILFTAGYRPHFINNSNFDVALEIGFEFNVDDGPPVTAVSDPDTVASGTTPQVFFGALFSESNVHTTPTANPVGDLVMPILDTARKPIFILDSADYEDEITVTREGGADHPNPITGILVEQRKDGAAAAGTGNGTQFMLVGECNPNANWGAIDAEDLSIEIEFTLKTPAVGWEFTTSELTALTVGAAIPGAHGLVVGNSLTAASFIDTSDSGPDVLGFIIGSSIPGGSALAGDPDDATATASLAAIGTGNISIPFNLGDATIGSVWIGSWNATTSFSHADGMLSTPRGAFTPAELTILVALNLEDGSYAAYTIVLTLTT